MLEDRHVGRKANLIVFNHPPPLSHSPSISTPSSISNNTSITLRISWDPATHGGNILSDVRVIGAHLQVKGRARTESSLWHWNGSRPPPTSLQRRQESLKYQSCWLQSESSNNGKPSPSAREAFRSGVLFIEDRVPSSETRLTTTSRRM